MSTFVWEFLSVVSNESWDSHSSSQRSWAQFAASRLRITMGLWRWKKRQSKTTQKHVEFALSESLWNPLFGLFFMQNLSLVWHTWKLYFNLCGKLAQRLIDSLSLYISLSLDLSLQFCSSKSLLFVQCCLIEWLMLSLRGPQYLLSFISAIGEEGNVSDALEQGSILDVLLHWPMVNLPAINLPYWPQNCILHHFLILKQYFLASGNAIFPLFSPVNVTMWLAASKMRSLLKLYLIHDCVAHIFMLVV